ncbi:MAG: GNAT family N-acetyltransferase [Spirochaetes bacterium]|nr:GNAT family N-acetyltransferase [Spirochaetota bacterium]
MEFFLAYRDGKPVGRITAHTYSKYEERYDKDTGFFGFYECIDDLDVSRALFDAARDWLRKKGKKTMNGPQSFSIYDSVGLDILGNDKTPVVGLFHFAGYYEKHVEAYGFEKQSDWFCFMVRQEALDWDPLFRIREELQKKGDIKYTTITRREIGKRATQIKEIFNSAWEGNEGHIPFTDKQWNIIFGELKMFVVPELAIFAEKDGKTIGFILSLPDGNPALQKLNGKLYPLRIIKALRAFKKTTTLRTILMGVLPEYRGQNIDQVLILMTIENGINIGYDKSDCSLVVESNKKMIGALKYVHADGYKGYRIYQLKV